MLLFLLFVVLPVSVVGHFITAATFPVASVLGFPLLMLLGLVDGCSGSVLRQCGAVAVEVGQMVEHVFFAFESATQRVVITTLSIGLVVPHLAGDGVLDSDAAVGMTGHILVLNILIGIFDGRRPARSTLDGWW